MELSTFGRMARLAAYGAAASLLFTACGGAGSSVGAPAGLSGSGSGTGSTGTGGSGSTGSTGNSAGGSGSGSSSGSAGGSGSGSGSGSAGGSGSGSGTSSSATSTLSVLPSGVSGNLGSLAQVAILDPNYSGPITVTAQGNQAVNTLLAVTTDLQSGVVAGASGTNDVLDVNLAKLLSLGVLGSGNTVLNICETAKSPAVCEPLTIASNATASEIGSNLADTVLVPGALQVLQLTGEAGLNGFTNFNVSVSNQGISVNNLGNGTYDLSAAADLAVPTTATITVTAPGQTTTIPVTVL